MFVFVSASMAPGDHLLSIKSSRGQPFEGPIKTRVTRASRTEAAVAVAVARALSKRARNAPTRR